MCLGEDQLLLVPGKPKERAWMSFDEQITPRGTEYAAANYTRCLHTQPTGGCFPSLSVREDPGLSQAIDAWTYHRSWNDCLCNSSLDGRRTVLANRCRGCLVWIGRQPRTLPAATQPQLSASPEPRPPSNLCWLCDPDLCMLLLFVRIHLLLLLSLSRVPVKRNGCRQHRLRTARDVLQLPRSPQGI